MPPDPLTTLARLRAMEVEAARRRLAEARSALARQQDAAAEAETALRAEAPDGAGATYGAFLARGLAARQSPAPKTRWSPSATPSPKPAARRRCWTNCANAAPPPPAAMPCAAAPPGSRTLSPAPDAPGSARPHPVVGCPRSGRKNT